MHGTRRVPVGLSLVALLTACASTSTLPPSTWDGLELRPAQAVDALYVNPRATFKSYRSVSIDPPMMSLDKNWRLQRDTTHVSSSLSDAEIEGYKATVSAAVRQIFEDELAAGGYRIANQPAPETLHVTLGLANLYMNTPPNTMMTWKDDGRMTLVMDLMDESTGQTLARVVDEEVGAFGALQMPNTVVNSVEFRRAVQDWARWLCASLDAAAWGATPGPSRG